MCTIPNPDMQPAREVQVPPSHRTWDAISEHIQPRGSVTERFLSCWSRATQLVMLGSQGQEEQSRQWRIETTRPRGTTEKPGNMPPTRACCCLAQASGDRPGQTRCRAAPGQFANRHPIDHVDGLSVVTDGKERQARSGVPRTYRRSFLPLKGLGSSPHFVRLCPRWRGSHREGAGGGTGKQFGRHHRNSHQIGQTQTVFFMHCRGAHPLAPDTTTNSSRSILRQSVLDRVCCDSARQIRDPRAIIVKSFLLSPPFSLEDPPIAP